jgi:hypothetical protein
LNITGTRHRKAAFSAPPPAPASRTPQRRAARGAWTRSARPAVRRRKAAGWLMGVGEIYIKLVTGFPDDRKVRALARFGAPDAGLARDLYVQMCLHCKGSLTDGFVSAEQVGLLVYPLDPEHGNQLAKQLASVGLIKELSKDEAQGWQVLAYLKRNGTKADVERLSQIRTEAGRAGGTKSRKRPAQRPSKATGKQVANQVADMLPSISDSVSDSEKQVRDRAIQEPAVPAGDAAGLTDTQRSKRLTDAYAEAEPMCKWAAVNGVVLRAIQSRKFTDGEIRAALLRMAAENRSVTIDSLRTELGGLPPRTSGNGRPSRRGGASDDLSREVYGQGRTRI